MKKKTGILSKIYIAILLIFLYSPIAVLIFYSFNNGKTTVWKGPLGAHTEGGHGGPGRDGDKLAAREETLGTPWREARL